MMKRKGKKPMSKKNWWIFAGLCLGVAGTVEAEPYIAVRTGFKCSVCHVNHTGGGKRTDYGYVYSQYQLIMKATQLESADDNLDPKLNKSISVGANFRVFQTHSLSYGWTPPDSTVTPYFAGDTADFKRINLGSNDATSIDEGNLYLEFDLIRNLMTLYMDETVAPTPLNREMWGMIQLPWNSYFKFGNMLLPYGFRLMDDQAFVRQYTGYTYKTTSLGYEVGIEPGPLSAIFNLTSNKFSTVDYVVFNNMPVIRTVRVGGSYAMAVRKQGNPTRKKDRQRGVFAGFSAGMFTVLGERDYITSPDSVYSRADYLELDVLPIQGFNIKCVYEYYWPDEVAPAKEDGLRRITVGVEPFIAPFLQVGLYYRKNDAPPQNGTANQDQIVGRFHAFF